MTVVAIQPPNADRQSPAKSHDRARRYFLDCAVPMIEVHRPEFSRGQLAETAEKLLEGALSPIDVLRVPYSTEKRPYTYFIRMEVRGRRKPIKIGSSVDPTDRLTQVATHTPYPVTLVASYSGVLLPEFYLHELLKRHRIRGEWFRPAPVLVALMEMICRLNRAGIR